MKTLAKDKNEEESELSEGEHIIYESISCSERMGEPTKASCSLSCPESLYSPLRHRESTRP